MAGLLDELKRRNLLRAAARNIGRRMDLWIIGILLAAVTLDAVTLNRAQGGTTNMDACDRYLRWRQLFLSDHWDAEHDRQRAHPDFKKRLREIGVVEYWRQTGKWGDGCRPRHPRFPSSRGASRIGA